MINNTCLNAKEREIHRHASEMLAVGSDAATFSSRFFGPSGELSPQGKSQETRRRLLETELYRWLQTEYAQLRLRDSRQFEQEVGAHHQLLR